MLQPNSCTKLTWAGERLALLPQRALYWPTASTLFITDPHFGKGATFRQAGLPVPRGGTLDDLAKLDAALTATHAERLIILGDFFHTRTSRAPHVLAALQQWRDAHASLAVTLVRGNHDRHAGDPPAALNIECVPEALALPPFVCLHHPLGFDDSSTSELDMAFDADSDAANVPAQAFALAGHLHPVVTLHGRGGSTLRLPCFYFGAQQALLPAFGRFTGGYPVRAVPGDRVFVVGEDEIIEANLA